MKPATGLAARSIRQAQTNVCPPVSPPARRVRGSSTDTACVSALGGAPYWSGRETGVVEC